MPASPKKPAPTPISLLRPMPQTLVPSAEMLDIVRSAVQNWHEREGMRIELATRVADHKFSIAKMTSVHDYRRQHDLTEGEKQLLTETFCRLALT